MKNKIKHWLLQIFATKIGLLGVSFILTIIFAILSNKYVWAETAIKLCLLYPIGLGLVMMVYGLFINPIKNYKSKKNSKK